MHVWWGAQKQEPGTFWPDPGLSRNTRCRCYRCSVPGLAGFTRLALCGARDLISHCSIANCRLPIGSNPSVQNHESDYKSAIGNLQSSITISPSCDAQACGANRLKASAITHTKQSQRQQATIACDPGQFEGSRLFHGTAHKMGC